MERLLSNRILIEAAYMLNEGVYSTPVRRRRRSLDSTSIFQDQIRQGDKTLYRPGFGLIYSLIVASSIPAVLQVVKTAFSDSSVVTNLDVQGLQLAALFSMVARQGDRAFPFWKATAANNSYQNRSAQYFKDYCKGFYSSTQIAPLEHLIKNLLLNKNVLSIAHRLTTLVLNQNNKSPEEIIRKLHLIFNLQSGPISAQQKKCILQCYRFIAEMAYAVGLHQDTGVQLNEMQMEISITENKPESLLKNVALFDDRLFYLQNGGDQKVGVLNIAQVLDAVVQPQCSLEPFQKPAEIVEIPKDEKVEKLANYVDFNPSARVSK